MKKRRSGQGLVEMALVLPIFVFIVMGIYDFSAAFHAWSSLNFQCVQAARVATKRVNQMIARNYFGPNTHATMDEVSAKFWATRSPWMRQPQYSNVTFSGIGTTDTMVTVSANYSLELITPGISSLVGDTNKSGALTITAAARERKE